jgi:hypothetical protein
VQQAAESVTAAGEEARTSLQDATSSLIQDVENQTGRTDTGVATEAARQAGFLERLQANQAALQERLGSIAQNTQLQSQSTSELIEQGAITDLEAAVQARAAEAAVMRQTAELAAQTQFNDQVLQLKLGALGGSRGGGRRGGGGGGRGSSKAEAAALIGAQFGLSPEYAAAMAELGIFDNLYEDLTADPEAPEISQAEKIFNAGLNYEDIKDLNETQIDLLLFEAEAASNAPGGRASEESKSSQGGGLGAIGTNIIAKGFGGG